MTITLHNPITTSKPDVCLLPIPADSGQGWNVDPSDTTAIMDAPDAVPLEVMADRYRPARNLVTPPGKGRKPPQWDDPRILTLLGYLELGAYRGQAITAAGLAERTVMRWLEVGRDEASRAENEDLPLTFYVHFWQSVRRAEGVPVLRALNVIRRAGARGSWRASAWFLERRYPDKWGRRATAWEREQEWSRSTKDVSCPVSVEDLEAKVLRILERRELQ
jgi:hypothetical protein